MVRKLSDQGVPPQGRCAKLEHQYGIERQPLESALRQAIDQQRNVNALIEGLAGEAKDWESRAHDLELRRVKARQAAERFKREIGTSAWFDEFTKDQLQARFAYVLRVVDAELELRALAAKGLAFHARLSTLRGPGRRARGIVDACLQSLVRQLATRHDRPVPRGASLEYVAALEQTLDDLDEPAGRLRDPGAALHARIRRHERRLDAHVRAITTKTAKTIKPSALLTAEDLAAVRKHLGSVPVGLEWPSANATVDEAIREASEIALGRSWPWPPLDAVVERSEARPQRRRFTTTEQERFSRIEDALLRLFAPHSSSVAAND